ncbi:MAG TPA: hypothetical protein VK524_26615 [Polyangiaceae bacterium]|nr:hypothetical protein [Polyangiaceae bacterium]
MSAGLENRFERGFVALSYLLGRRGAELTAGLAQPSSSALLLQRALSAPTREERARVLAAELVRLTAALETWRRG